MTVTTCVKLEGPDGMAAKARVKRHALPEVEFGERFDNGLDFRCWIEEIAKPRSRFWGFMLEPGERASSRTSQC